MQPCVQCGKDSTYKFCALEVHTLPIRDFTGEKKVQALGDFKEFSVCTFCSQVRLNSILNPIKNTCIKLIPCFLIFSLGIVLNVFFKVKSLPIKMLGLAAVFCGITVSISVIQKALKQKKDFLTLNNEEALEQAAWLCVLAKAAKKFNENDLSYIPVTKKTLDMKNGDLMILYNLLPQIALQAYEKIHNTRSSSEE